MKIVSCIILHNALNCDAYTVHINLFLDIKFLDILIFWHLFCLEAFDCLKKTHFIENNEIFCRLVSETGQSLMAIENLFAASIVNGGPGRCVLALWVYHYSIDGLDSISSFLPSRVDDRSLYSTAYNEVRINLWNIVGTISLNIL